MSESGVLKAQTPAGTGWRRWLPPRAGVRAAAGWTLCGVLVAAVVGVVWIATAPRVAYQVSDGQASRVMPQPDQYFGADLYLGCMLAAAGALLATVWLVRGRRQLPAATLGLILGGLIGGVLAAAAGSVFTSVDVANAAESATNGVTIEAGVKLRSTTMLLWWPALVAALVAGSLWLRPLGESSPGQAVPDGPSENIGH